jgi:hypothetical protein
MRQALLILSASMRVGAALLIAPDVLFRASLQVARDGRIVGAQCVGFDQSGHTWIGHNDEVTSEIITLFVPPGSP